MKKEFNYITIDGRGEHESFKDCITSTIQTLKPNEGIHIIKDFEPFPMYKMMQDKGFDKHLEKISDNEFHVYFTPKKELRDIDMSNHIKTESTKIKKLVEIKLNFINGNISIDNAKKQVHENYKSVTAQEFAICEQYLQDYGISDDVLAAKMDDILKIFEGVLVSNKINLPKGHPIRTYLDEIQSIGLVLDSMKQLKTKKFIKNEWAILYDKLSEINIHFARKQNQLFPALENKGFDKPSKVMWTLDNDIRDIIKKAATLLENNKDEEFLNLQKDVIEMVEDMMVKEEEILLPTSLDLLSDKDFIELRKGDDEIGYCLIDDPLPYKDTQDNNKNNELLKDLTEVLNKHGVKSSNSILDVSQGKLTLEQINLIFRHLKVDLSYVDENEIVKFYSDTKHRVFPRSAGVIGRKVQNCHPRESVDTVEEIIKAFKNGEQDEAEFWLEMGDKFIYIVYNAVRDEFGKFRGVLEMMQDATHIRSLQGSQKLLSWNNNNDDERNETIKKNKYGINGDTIIGDLVKEYSFIKEYLYKLSPKFKKLKNPVIFKTMSKVASLRMISQKGDIDLSILINGIVNEIEKEVG